MSVGLLMLRIKTLVHVFTKEADKFAYPLALDLEVNVHFKIRSNLS
jgi:hypothetical protein